MSLVGPGRETKARAELEYRRFLHLRLREPTEAIVPSTLCDEVWHAHILDTEAYARDCQNLFGEFLHHVPRYGDDLMETLALYAAFERTCARYRAEFGEELHDAARCTGKPCHAPTPCRCR